MKNSIPQLLRNARKAYYGSDSPLMTDAEFDALEDELRKNHPQHEYFSSVGHGVHSDKGKIFHRVPMLSMGKAKDLTDIGKWLERLTPTSFGSLVVQPKVDGLSASVYYQNGRRKYVATRGDGQAGQDISHIAKFIKDIPETIALNTEPLEIRGELHLPKDTAYNTGGRPLRNNCVGLINRKENTEDLKHVRFLAYQIVWPESGNSFSGGTAATSKHIAIDGRWASEHGKIALLAEHGFYTFDTWLLKSDTHNVVADILRQLRNIYSEYMDLLRDTWNYETDGLILVVDDNRLHEGIDERWVVDHHHHYALAFKPPPQVAFTTLREVIWQVSRQGNLTPVARFDPVSMGGAVLERASLHNAGNVLRLKLAMGDSIIVERANDVIPCIRKNPDGAGRAEHFKDISLWPDQCPSCSSALEDRGVNIVCPNLVCRDRVLQSILYWVRQTAMEQIALKTLVTLYDAGKLRSIRDLYTLNAEDFNDLDGFGDKKITNFLEQVAASAHMVPADLIARLGIPMVQKKALDRLGIVSMEDFFKFHDASYVIGQRIIDWKAEESNMAFLKELMEVIEVQESEILVDRKGVICLTGKAPLPRKQLIMDLTKIGWVVAGAVTRDTDKVVCDDVQGSSVKLKKAREAGIDIVTYESFLTDIGLKF